MMNERTPRIDDRTFQDLVDTAKRMIPQLCPEWTNHGPTDPGIALIEIFAWMTEQVLYKLNHVPEQLFDELLRLVGLDTFPARAARTSVTFFASGPLDQPLSIPAGTTVATASTGGVPAVAFQTEHDAQFGPVVLDTALRSDRLGVLDLTQSAMTGIQPFEPFDPRDPETALLLGFEQSCSDHVLQLTVGTVDDLSVDGSDPHSIIWETWWAAGEAWWPAHVLSDTTGCLSRSGEVILAIGPESDALDIDGYRAHWLRARPCPGEERTSATDASPRVSSIAVAVVGASVAVTHSAPMAMEYLGTADGSPGLSFRTSQSPVLPLSADETVFVRDEAWIEVADFSSSGPLDRHFTFASETGTVRFGPRVHRPDGSATQYGMVPGYGAEVTISGYRVGGGAHGNVGADTLTVLQTPIPYVSRVSNPLPATDGADAETIDNARRRVPLWLQTGDRAVTAVDFERIALEADPNVGRARCIEDGERQVLLALVPRTVSDRPFLDALALDLVTLDRVVQYVDERRLLGTSVEVGTPTYVGVSVVARVSARPGRSVERVREHCLDVLAWQLHPTTGGSDGNGWAFGRDVDAYSIVGVLSAVEGIDRVDDVLLFEADTRDERRTGRARDRIAIDDGSLPLLVSPQVVVE